MDEAREAAKRPTGERGSAQPSPPAYLRIANTLAGRITSGVYAADSRLPSGSELCREFGVSPMTVRRAVAILGTRGLISGEKGRGIFARPLDLSDSMFRLDSPTGEWLDESAEIQLLTASMTRADDRAAAMLGLSTGDRVVLENTDGVKSLPVAVTVTEGIRSDCVYLVHGFGQGGTSLRLASGKGASDTGLMTRVKVDPLMGGTGMRVNFVRPVAAGLAGLGG